MTLRRYRNKYFVGAKRWVTTPGAVETASYAGVSEETDSILVVSPPLIFRTELAKASAIAVGDLSRFYAATREGVVAIFNAAAVILESASLEADGNAIAVDGDVVYLSRTGARLARVDDLAVSYEVCLTRSIAGIIVGSGVLYVMTDDARLLTVHEDEVRETFDIIDELALPAAFGLRDFVLTDEVLYLVGTDRLGNGSVVAVDVEDPEAPELLSVDRVESPFVVLTTDGFGHVGTEQPQTPYTTPNVPWQGRTDCIRTAGAPTPPPPDTPPVNTVAPALSGSPEVGVELTCSTGTWTGTAPITYSYQWQRDNGGPVEDIGDGTNAYTVEEADLGYSIYCLVTATNTVGDASALSDTFVIADPPVNTVQPVITGSTVVGQILSCSDGTWTGATPITFTYAWYHDGDEGTTLGTDATYEIESGDVGFAMVCRVTATNSFGFDDAAADPTGIVVAALDPDTELWIARVAANLGTITDGDISIVDDWIVGAKADGFWGDLDRANFFVGQDLAAALTPIKQGNGYSLEVSSNFVEADFDPAVGLNSVGVPDKVLDTGWQASLVQTTASASVVLVNEDTAPQDRAAIGCVDDEITPANILQVYPIWSDNRQYVNLHTQAARIDAARTQASARGVLVADRTSTTSLISYVDGASIASGAVLNTDTPPADPMLVFSGRFSAGIPLYCKCILGGYAVGTGLGPTKVAALTARLTTLAAALGRPH